jgi:outer membrane lipoprotein-sorting protein
MKHLTLLLLFINMVPAAVKAQRGEELILKIKQKLDKVNDYEATGKMKMNVVFIKAPVADIKVYFKKPDKLKIINESGISLVPKGSINISIGNVIGNIGGSDIIEAGKDDKTGLTMIKLLPKDDNANVVLSILYIDEKQMLVKKARTTTRENGTYELEMIYGRYTEYGLADKVIFSFNTKDYKLPKGVSLDYEDGSGKQPDANKTKENKGIIELTYSTYSINKGVADSIFK